MPVAGTLTAIFDANNATFMKKAAAVLAKLGEFSPSVNKAGRALDILDAKLAKLSNAMSSAGAAAASLTSTWVAWGKASAAYANNTARAAFKSLGGDIESLREATQGMISDSELIKKANLAQTMKITGETFKTLAQIALASAAKTGQSVKYLFDSIIVGTARQSKPILDNLAILVSVQRANSLYAASIGKTAKTLSDADKRQAFLNAVQKDGARILQELKDAGIDILNPFARMEAQFSNVTDELGNMMIPAFKELLDTIDPIAKFILQLGKDFRRLRPEVAEVATRFSSFVLHALAIVGVAGSAAVAISLLSGAMKAGALMAAGMLIPFTKIAVVVVLLVSLVGALAKAWDQNLGGMRDKAVWFAEAVGTVFSAIYRWGKEKLDNLLTFYTWVVDSMVLLAATPAYAMLLAFEKVFGVIESVIGRLAKVVEGLGFDGMAKKFKSAQGAIAGMRATVQGFQHTLDDTVDTAQGLLTLGGVLRPEDDPRSMSIADAGKSVVKYATEFGGLVADGWKILLKKAGIDVGNLFVDSLDKGGKTLKQDMEDGGEAAGKKIKEALPNSVADLLKSPLGRTFDRTGLKATEGERKMLLEDAAQGLAGLFTGDGADTEKLGRSAGGLAGLAGALGGGLTGPQGAVIGGAIVSAVSSAIPAIVEAFQAVAGMIVQAAQVIPAAMDKAAEGLSNLTGDSRIKEAFSATGASAFTTVAGIVALSGALVSLVGAVNFVVSNMAAIASGPVGLSVAAAGAWVSAHLAVLGAAVAVVTLPLIAFGAALAAASMAAGGFLSLATQTESFSRLQDGFAESLDRVVDALEPFFSNLMAFVGLFDAVVSVIEPMAAAFANSALASRVVFEAFKMVALAIGAVLLALAVFVSGVLAIANVGLNAMANLVDGFGFLQTSINALSDSFLYGGALFLSGVKLLLAGLGLLSDGMRDSLNTAIDALFDNIGAGSAAANLSSQLKLAANAADGASPDISAMAQALAALAGLTYEEAEQRGSALADQRAHQEEIQASQVNVADGFKVEAARFRAITPGLGPNEALYTDTTAPTQGGTNIFLQGDINIASDNPADILSQFERRIMEETGTTGTSGNLDNGS